MKKRGNIVHTIKVTKRDVCTVTVWCLSGCYFMIHTFSFVIQQPFNEHSTLFNINKPKVRGRLDNVAGKSVADELNLNLIVNEGFIYINPSFQGFVQINS